MNQSTATIRVTSATGRPTAVRTIKIVTRPPCGTEAAPIDARVAVRLTNDFIDNINMPLKNNQIYLMTMIRPKLISIPFIWAIKMVPTAS
jgi:hypothetical protein